MLKLSLAAIAAVTLLAGCGNTYGPPPADNKPQNYGQQRYLEDKRYQQQTQDRMNLPN
jgi:predicted small lipoprotein YifL